MNPIPFELFGQVLHFDPQGALVGGILAAIALFLAFKYTPGKDGKK